MASATNPNHSTAMGPNEPRRVLNGELEQPQTRQEDSLVTRKPSTTIVNISDIRPTSSADAGVAQRTLSSREKVLAALSPQPVSNKQTILDNSSPSAEPILSPLSRQVASTLERLAAERSMEPLGPAPFSRQDLFSNSTESRAHRGLQSSEHSGSVNISRDEDGAGSVEGDAPERLAAAVSTARAKLLAFYSAYNPSAVPFVDGVLVAAGIAMPPTPLQSSTRGRTLFPSSSRGTLLRVDAIRAASDTLLTELTRAQLAKERTNRSLSRSLGRSASAKDDHLARSSSGLRSPSPPVDSRPRGELYAVTGKGQVRSISTSQPNHHRTPAGTTTRPPSHEVVHNPYISEPPPPPPATPQTHKTAIKERDALILQLSTALEEKTTEVEELTKEVRQQSRADGRGAGVNSVSRQDHDAALREARELIHREKESEMERLMELLSDMERRYVEGVEETVPNLERQLVELRRSLAEEKEKRLEISRELMAKSDEVAELRKRDVLATTEAERLQSTVSVREHQVRLLRMQFDQLQQEGDWKEEKIQRQGALLTEYGDKIHSLMEENAALRLQVPRDFDDGSGGSSPNAARRGFMSLVKELQEEFEKQYSHRLKLAESEMNDYFAYAKKQIANRDEIIESISERVERRPQEVLEAATKRLADVYPEKELLLAEEVAKLQMQLAQQQEQHKALLMRLSVPSGRHSGAASHAGKAATRSRQPHGEGRWATSPHRDGGGGGSPSVDDALPMLTPSRKQQEQQEGQSIGSHQVDNPYTHHHVHHVPPSHTISRTSSGSASVWKQVAGEEVLQSRPAQFQDTNRLNQFRARRSLSRDDASQRARLADAPSSKSYFYNRPPPEPVHSSPQHQQQQQASIYASRSPSIPSDGVRRSVSSGGGGGYAAPRHVSMMYDRLAGRPGL